MDHVADSYSDAHKFQQVLGRMSEKYLNFFGEFYTFFFIILYKVVKNPGFSQVIIFPYMDR